MIIAALGLLGSYLMILIAFQIERVSYTVSLRQVNVIIGTILGVVILKESFGKIRILGALLIFAGAFLLGIS